MNPSSTQIPVPVLRKVRLAPLIFGVLTLGVAVFALGYLLFAGGTAAKWLLILIAVNGGLLGGVGLVTPVGVVELVRHQDAGLAPNVAVEGVHAPALAARKRSVELLAGREPALVGELLDISRIEAGKYPIELTDVPLAQLITRIVETMEPRATAPQRRLSDPWL